MSQIRQIVYLSTAMPKMSDPEIAELVKQAAENNQRDDITGLLLYCDGTFMQTIEGPPPAVDQLYKKIKADPRHRQITTILDLRRGARQFGEWNMACHHSEALKPIDAIVDIRDEVPRICGHLSAQGPLGAQLSSMVERIARHP